jgi:hypothetical protein
VLRRTAKLETAAFDMEAKHETGHHASLAKTFLKPTLSASGSWLSAVAAPQRQHFFLTSDEARRKLDAYFDHEKVRTARAAPLLLLYCIWIQHTS